MAVYTKLNKENIEEILSNYSIGQLKEFKGIEEGIENTNYFLIVDTKKYILIILMFVLLKRVGCCGYD